VELAEIGMGKFMCWCGYVLGGSSSVVGVDYYTIPEEDFDLAAFPSNDDVQRPGRIADVGRVSRKLVRCPNVVECIGRLSMVTRS
jgi:hypothetical protein